MQSRAETVFAAMLGVVGFGLTVLGGLLAGEFNDPWGDSSAIVSFYQSTAFDAPFVIGMVLETLGFLLIMAFVGKVADVVRGGGDRARWAGTVIVSSVVVATVFTIVSVVALGAGTFRAANGGFAGDGFVVLTDVRNVAWWLSLPAWALVYLIGGALIVRLRSYPQWLGWAALIIGAGHMVVTFIQSGDAWTAATGLGGLWLLAIAVSMLARPSRYAT